MKEKTQNKTKRNALHSLHRVKKETCRHRCICGGESFYVTTEVLLRMTIITMVVSVGTSFCGGLHGASVQISMYLSQQTAELGNCEDSHSQMNTQNERGLVTSQEARRGLLGSELPTSMPQRKAGVSLRPRHKEEHRP